MVMWQILALLRETAFDVGSNPTSITIFSDGVTGNTSDFGSEDFRFEP